MCLDFWKSEPQYAYERYAYKNMYFTHHFPNVSDDENRNNLNESVLSTLVTPNVSAVLFIICRHIDKVVNERTYFLPYNCPYKRQYGFRKSH